MRLLIIIGTLFFLVWLGGMAEAVELVVIRSTAPGLKPGQVVDGNKKLKLPAGVKLTLISQDGKPLTLEGPFSGIPQTGKSEGRKLTQALARLITSKSKDISSLGGVRAATSPGAMAPNPWAIRISRSGDHCLLQTRPTVFWRKNTRKKESLSVKLVSNGQKSKVNWPKGEAMSPWPAGLNLVDGSAYLLRSKGTTIPKKLVVHLVPKNLSSVGHRAVWMAQNGCSEQAQGPPRKITLIMAFPQAFAKEGEDRGTRIIMEEK